MTQAVPALPRVRTAGPSAVRPRLHVARRKRGAGVFVVLAIVFTLVSVVVPRRARAGPLELDRLSREMSVARRD
jgi:hypothetical protein